MRMYQWFVLCMLVICFSGCSVIDTENKKEILAKIGDKVITRQDFIRRSEYTLRPDYCRQNSYIDKKIVLNSLIAEKLLAIDAGEDNALERNADFRAYLEGRKEQAMRQLHFYEEAYKKIKISPEVLQTEYKVAGRRYQISYFTIPDQKISEYVSAEFKSGHKNFEEMYFHLTGDTVVPSREVNWESPENEEIHSLLYKGQPKKNEIIGPLPSGENKFLYLKVDGWVDRVIMSETAAEDRMSMVREKLTNVKAREAYQLYVSRLMKNKKMQFYPQTFKRLVEVVAPVYIKSEEQKKQLFNSRFWKGKKEEEILSELPESLDDMNHQPLFSVDGKIWTVEKFRSYLKRHPLVFRKEDIRIRNFAEQLKLSIADLVRDFYITRDAYEKGYDTSEMVSRNVEMWKDNMVALFQKYHYLKKTGTIEKDQIKVVRKQMTPYIDSLQEKYQHLVEINIPEFEKVELTRIDMLVIRPDQPFPVVVPSFPLLTDDNRLDYGRIME